jgi:hypothetical protein
LGSLLAPNSSKSGPKNEPKCLPKPIPKSSRNYHGKKQENYENIIRKRSAKTSQSMLPCRRGALLAKSASFKKIPEDIQINHEILTKIYQKNIKKTIQNPSQK